MANSQRLIFSAAVNLPLLEKMKTDTTIKNRFDVVPEAFINDGQVGSTDYYCERDGLTIEGLEWHKPKSLKFNSYKGSVAPIHPYSGAFTLSNKQYYVPVEYFDNSEQKIFSVNMTTDESYKFTDFAQYDYEDVSTDNSTGVGISSLYRIKGNWYNWGDKWGTAYIGLKHGGSIFGTYSKDNPFNIVGSLAYIEQGLNENIPNIPFKINSDGNVYVDKNTTYLLAKPYFKGKVYAGNAATLAYIDDSNTLKEVFVTSAPRLVYERTYYPTCSIQILSDPSNFKLPLSSNETLFGEFLPTVDTYTFSKKKHNKLGISYDKANNVIVIKKPTEGEYSPSIGYSIDGLTEEQLKNKGVLFKGIGAVINGKRYYDYTLSNLPKDLVYGTHTVSAYVNTDTYPVIDYARSKVVLLIYTQKDSYGSEYGYPKAYNYRLNAYTRSDTNTFTYENKAETPTDLKIEQLDVDKIKLSWKYSDTTAVFAVKQELNYDHIIHPVQSSTQETSMIIDNLPLGNHRFSVAAAYPEAPEGLSNFVVATYASNKLLAPYSISFTRKTVNSGSITWKTQTVQDKFTSLEYGIKINGTLDGEYIKDKSKLIYNLSQGRNKISVFTHYPKNPDYDSIEYDTYPELSKISAPTIKLTENYSDVTYTDPDTGETVIVKGEDGQPKQGVSSVTVSWYSDDASKYTGIEYVLYDRFNDVVNEQPRTSDTKINLTTQATFKGVGRHNLYVKAIYTGDEGYNSDNSSEVYYDINTLAKPKLVWSNDLPDWNGKKIEESKLTWLPVTTGSANNNHADYYLIKAIANNQQRGNSITLLQPADLNKRVSTFIPDPDPYTGAIKGLIDEDPAITTDYKINVYAMSFNEFYVGGSEPATADYKIIRLSAPQNVIWTPDNLTLSWEAVAEANTYYLYDDNIKIDETNSTSYKFAHIEDKLHVFNITANKITTEEA